MISQILTAELVMPNNNSAFEVFEGEKKRAQMKFLSYLSIKHSQCSWKLTFLVRSLSSVTSVLLQKSH